MTEDGGGESEPGDDDVLLGRPIDETPLDTAELPMTPQRDRTIPATAWRQAPAALLEIGRDLQPAHEVVSYKRRIGRWTLWRAGPASRGEARYGAVAIDDPTHLVTFRLWADGRGEGAGPSGEVHTRFRSWKQDLQAADGS